MRSGRRSIRPSRPVYDTPVSRRVNAPPFTVTAPARRGSSEAPVTSNFACTVPLTLSMAGVRPWMRPRSNALLSTCRSKRSLDFLFERKAATGTWPFDVGRIAAVVNVAAERLIGDIAKLPVPDLEVGGNGQRTRFAGDLRVGVDA